MKLALTVVVFTVLTGCSGPQPQPGVLSTPSFATAQRDTTLLYVTDPQASDVYMIGIPSGRLAGKLTGLYGPTGDCADQHGNVFVDVSGSDQIRAYAHRSKSAFRVLNDSSWQPMGCSIDPTTGNLAVCNVRTTESQGSIAIYSQAKGAARLYEYPGISNFWYCAYDSNGNLFADAIDYGHERRVFLELRSGHAKLRPISLSPAIAGDVVTPLFWDGKYLAIAAPSTGVIYQYKIKDESATRIKVVKLDDASEISGPFWISSSGGSQTLYAPIVEDSIQSVGVYHYPAGGKRIQNLYDAPLPYAAAVSAPN